MKKTSLAVVAAIGALTLAIPMTGAATGDTSNVVDEPPVSHFRVAPTTSPDERALTAPPVTGEMVDISTKIDGLYEDDPRYSAVEFTKDRSLTIVWWHGEVPAELESIVASTELPMEVRQTPYLPGDLREAVQTVLGSDEATAAGVLGGGPAADGSGIELTLAPSDAARSSNIAEARLESVSEYPVAITHEGVTPLNNRQFDTYGLGGSKMTRYDGVFLQNSCSTGFPVRRISSNPVQYGLMTADHCGDVGSQWVIDDGSTAYIFGSMIAANEPNDGAIVTRTTVHPFIYVNAYNSGNYTQLNGASPVAVGSEICYSGSYSGLVCGNFVTTRPYTWTIPGDPTRTGFRTEKSATGVGGAGQGDSGGPGYQLVNTNGTLTRYAAAIISAGAANPSVPCQGTQGRVCGYSVYATEPLRIAQELGWQLYLAY